MSRSGTTKFPCPAEPFEEDRVPTAVELAEALLGTAHAFKQWGNLCFSQAEPGLRELSMPRARLLAVVADADLDHRSVRMPAHPQRGHFHRGAGRGDHGHGGHAGQGRVRMGDLAAMLGVTPRNVTTIVDGLEREGLLVRLPDPTDRRAILLKLTEKGWAHVEHVHALQRDLAQGMFAPLNPDERRSLYALLSRLASHLFQSRAGGEMGESTASASSEAADWQP